MSEGLGKRATVALTVSPDDIEVTADGQIKINHKRVTATLKRMIEAAKEDEVRAASEPTALRVSA